METKPTLIRIKWGTSRGRNTYGYTICTLYANGKKEISTNGGGYDMQGTVLARYIVRYYLPRLLTLTGNHGSEYDGTGFYGLMFYGRDGSRSKVYRGEADAVSLDGACGWSSMIQIAEAIGLEIKYLEENHYLLTDKRATV